MRKTATAEVPQKTIALGKTTAALVFGGAQHKGATSFLPARIAQYEREKLFREQGIIWVAPTRGSVWTSVVVSWFSLQWPPNHFRSPLFVSEKLEVAAAYNGLIGATIDKAHLRKVFVKDYADMLYEAPFVLTTEEDNVLPQDTVPQLMKAIYGCPDCGAEVGGAEWQCPKGHRGFDAVSGLYFMKSDPPIPMAFGNPAEHKGRWGRIDFHPRSVKAAIKRRSVIEVSGIAMGCALWRKDLFRRVSQPWFASPSGWTQDLWFCKKAKSEAKARFGVHCGVRVGHYNPKTGVLY